MMEHKGHCKWVFDYPHHTTGAVTQRRVIPHSFTFRSQKPWYPTATWLMRGYDLDKRDYRDYAVYRMANIEEMPL